MKVNYAQQIIIECVCLSEISAVVSIYREKKTPGFSENPIGINDDFGLPIAVAFLNKKVIGYSTIKIDDQGDWNVSPVIIDDFFSPALFEALKVRGSKEFKRIFEKEEERLSKLKACIKRLTYWLNLTFI